MKNCPRHEMEKVLQCSMCGEWKHQDDEPEHPDTARLRWIAEKGYGIKKFDCVDIYWGNGSIDDLRKAVDEAMK